MDEMTRHYTSALQPPLSSKREAPSRNDLIPELRFGDDSPVRPNKSKSPPKRKNQTRSYREKVNISSDYIRLPVIRMSRTDKGQKIRKKGNMKSVRHSHNDHPRISSPYSYANESEASTVQKSTGILDTIKEEWNKDKKESILKIFDRNYDSTSPTKRVKAKLSTPKRIKSLKKNLTNPLKNYTNKYTNGAVLDLQKKIKSYSKKRKSEHTSLVYGRKNSNQRYGNHSMFASNDSMNSSKYDPKHDRYKLLRWIMKNQSKSKNREKVINDSIFSKYTSGRKTNRYLSGQLSYSNIAAKVATDKNGSLNIKL